jgi:hypothetical protein
MTLQPNLESWEESEVAQSGVWRVAGIWFFYKNCYPAREV